MFAALFFAATLNTNAQGVIDIRITSEESYPANKSVDLRITLTNISNDPVRLLNYYTPVNGIEEDILSISLAEKLIDHIGPIYKRAAPDNSEYITLNPGASISGTVSLDGNYDIAVSGRYAIRYNTVMLSEQLNRDKSPHTEDVFSNTIYIDIEGREPPPEPEEEDDGDSIVDGRNEFQLCSESKKNDLRTARQHALNYADDSYDYLIYQPNGARYLTWFGTNNISRLSSVRANFRRIRDAIDNERFKFKCNCNQNVYAWVLPLQNHNIHICRLFWDAPMTGTDSKAGTLIHEVSHFFANAGTKDKAYGHTASMNLANTNPNDAIKNADNHEYFAEATFYTPYNPCPFPVYLSTGGQINPYWEGANCQLIQAPSGTTPFIYNNSYYIKAFHGTSCPSPSWYDGANCYVMAHPPLWRTNYFIYAGNLYLTPGPGNACLPPSSFDGANCYIMPLPWGSSPFTFANNLYITPPPNCPIGAYDGANCYIGSAPVSRTAFIWESYFYYHH